MLVPSANEKGRWKGITSSLKNQGLSGPNEHPVRASI